MKQSVKIEMTDRPASVTREQVRAAVKAYRESLLAKKSGNTNTNNKVPS